MVGKRAHKALPRHSILAVACPSSPTVPTHPWGVRRGACVERRERKEGPKRREHGVAARHSLMGLPMADGLVLFWPWCLGKFCQSVVTCRLLLVLEDELPISWRLVVDILLWSPVSAAPPPSLHRHPVPSYSRQLSSALPPPLLPHSACRGLDTISTLPGLPHHTQHPT